MAKIKSGGFDEKALSMLALLVGDEAANLFAKMDEEEQAVSFFILILKGMGADKEDCLTIGCIFQMLLEKEHELTSALIYGLMKVYFETK